MSCMYKTTLKVKKKPQQVATEIVMQEKKNCLILNPVSDCFPLGIDISSDFLMLEKMD